MAPLWHAAPSLLLLLIFKKSHWKDSPTGFSTSYFFKSTEPSLPIPKRVPTATAAAAADIPNEEISKIYRIWFFWFWASAPRKRVERRQRRFFRVSRQRSLTFRRGCVTPRSFQKHFWSTTTTPRSRANDKSTKVQMLQYHLIRIIQNQISKTDLRIVNRSSKGSFLIHWSCSAHRPLVKC